MADADTLLSQNEKYTVWGFFSEFILYCRGVFVQAEVRGGKVVVFSRSWLTVLSPGILCF